MFTGFYITDKGHQYIAKATSGKTLVFTKGQYGDGQLPEDTTILSMTSLISPLADLVITKQYSMENSAVISTLFSNKVNGSLLTPFHLMEAGIFGKVTNADGTDDEDAPETLLLYTNALTEEKADYIPGVLTEFQINWPLTISESANVTINIDESLVYPTLKEFNERVPFNIAIATDEEAEAGTDDTKMMTPQKVALYVDNKIENAGTTDAAKKLETARNINGMSFDGSADRVNYGTCSTAAATAAKTVSCDGFSLITGAEITVKFTMNNTASSPTLNVNGTGAKPIYYRGAAITAGYLAMNRTYTFRYNGTQWELVGDINTDTKYSAATASASGLMAATDKANLDNHIENNSNPHGVTALQATYDNSVSGLSATTAQGAIDELKNNLGDSSVLQYPSSTFAYNIANILATKVQTVSTGSVVSLWFRDEKIGSDTGNKNGAFLVFVSTYKSCAIYMCYAGSDDTYANLLFKTDDTAPTLSVNDSKNIIITSNDSSGSVRSVVIPIV